MSGVLNKDILEALCRANFEKIANYLKKYLQNEKIENDKQHIGKSKYYLTDTQCNFIQVAGKLLQDESLEQKIQKVNIE